MYNEYISEFTEDDNMKIAVYCGSSAGNDIKYKEAAVRLGEWMARNGHELVFGASDSGLMGAVANAVLDNGGKAIGVVPDVPIIKKQMHKGLTETILTADMSERKKTMLELADAYIALPGGIGTLDEITEVICLSQLRIHTKPSVLFDLDGYYQPLKELFAMMERAGFAHAEGNGRVLFSSDIEEIESFLS